MKLKLAFFCDAITQCKLLHLILSLIAQPLVACLVSLIPSGGNEGHDK